MSQRLDESTIAERASTLSNWEVKDNTLHQTFKFKDFVEAIAFVNKLVSPAEALGHHPDISISYNKVSVTLTTHDAGGLTDLDFQLAQALSNLG